MFETVVFRVDNNGHAAAESREAQRWIHALGTSLCDRLVAARDGEGQSICRAHCASRLVCGEREERPARHAIVRGHLCQLQCRRDGDQALVTIQPLSRRACTKVHHLTTLERQILSLLADGATVDELATSMGLSGGTIRVHLDHIQRRLRLRPEPDGDEQERRHVRLRVLQELKDNHFRR